MRVYLSLPSYDQRYWGNTMMSVLHCGSKDMDGEVCPDPISGSLLPRVFNEALGRAVVRGYDIFCMLHADLAAEPGWLVKMLRVAKETDADVLSAVVPVKDERHLTSTAVHTSMEQYRKLSLDECHQQCSTSFDIDDPHLQAMGATSLLLNTGLMLMRLDRPWLKQWDGFQIRSRIIWGGDETVIDTTGEDWDMSEQLNALQCRLVATTAVRVHHFGCAVYDSHLASVLSPPHTRTPPTRTGPPGGSAKGESK
jgi:hypothetical protein